MMSVTMKILLHCLLLRPLRPKNGAADCRRVRRRASRTDRMLLATIREFG